MRDPAGDLAALAGTVVLVVEDDPASARLVSMVLRGLAGEVIVAGSATEATRLVIGGLQPSLVVLDLHLPDLTGMDLARVLRSLDGTRTIPIIAVTASGIAFGEHAARAAGCDGFVRKPIDPIAFPAQIAAFLR